MSKNEINLKRIRYLATQLYMHTLQEKSMGLSFGKIEISIKNNSNDGLTKKWRDASGAFYKYAKGKARIKDLELIDYIYKVEIYSGSKYVLNHPLWLILENPNAAPEMLSDYIHKLNIDIQTLLYSFNRETNQYEPKTFNDTKFITKIGINNNIDALACYLILLREMEIKKNWQLYVEIKWNLYQLLIRLTNFSPWLHIKKELCSLIHQYFMSNNDPITINYFPSFIQKVIPDYMHIYKSPPPIINCIDGQDYFYELIESPLCQTSCRA